MDRARIVLAVSFTLAVAVMPARAVEGPFIGLDLGASEAINGNYRGHVQTGLTANPFAGYMFSEYIGIQGQFYLDYHNSDLHLYRGGGNDNQGTTMFGATIGPRVDIPLGGPFGDLFTLYGTTQGGVFTGLSGRLNQTAMGVSLGGGLDLNVTDTVTVGLFSRWNYSWMKPTPNDLGEDQVPDERFAEDIEWFTGGLGFKVAFPQEPAPPPPPPAPAIERTFALRNVYFDFDRESLRPDAIPILDGVVTELKGDEEIAIVAEGHADSRGTAKYNMGLSRRRAERVKAYLVDHGVAEGRIRVEAAGETKPAAPNTTPEGRAKNRRVEIRVD